MKKLPVFLALTMIGTAGYSQTLITYGNSTVDKAEFLRAYNRNKTAAADKEKALREYLELYTNFKLKVKAAQEARIDTVSQVKYDTENFREQVANNYLNNEQAMQQLTDEAIERAAKDIHIIYFSVPVAEDASPADTAKAFAAAKEIYNEVKKGNTNYAELVTNVSAKTVPARFNDAGYVTAFSLPYEYENLVYKTAEGSISEPYRSKRGWIMFRPVDSRPAAGKWKAAQIMFAYPPNADYNTKLAVKEKADSVYHLLPSLAFDEAAKQFSDDRMTYLTGGELPEFSTGRYTAVFEKNVFALKNDGDFTKPFETEFGYHIVKRLGHTPVPAATDANYRFEIKQKVQQDPRINAEKEQFAKEIRQKTGFKLTKAVSDAELFRDADSVKKNPAANDPMKMPISKKVIISFKEGPGVNGADWLKYVKENASNAEEHAPVKDLWNRFTSQSVLNYYKKHLDEYNQDFKYQMQEFREGNMLFEVMERNVWGRAGADSVALLNYYNAHKNNYKWEAAADVLIVNATDEKKAAAAMQKLKDGKSWQALAEESNNTIQADSGRFELSQLPGAPSSVQAGTYSSIIKNPDGSVVFMKYLHTYEANMQRNFAEARGLVVNDYQTVLEKQWVDQLRKKYPVKINEAVFNEMLK